MTMLSIEPQHRDERWDRIAAHAPVLAATCHDYVAQISVTARPSTVIQPEYTAAGLNSTVMRPFGESSA